MGTKATASVSLDMDNLWSYQKIHGDPQWEQRSSYLPALVPRMLEVFDEHRLAATVFVVGADAVRDDGAEAVRAIHEAGHEVGNHSFEHEPWMNNHSREMIDSELARTEDAITIAGAPRPVGFRGPGYILSPVLVELLAERKYLYDGSTLPTWIGPLARWYYFRGASLSAGERAERDTLFGLASEGLRPVHAYRWLLDEHHEHPGPVEIPVTTVPLLRVPMHLSYVIQLHSISPRLARSYFSLALRMCQLRNVAPSILLHPLDLLDGRDAPGLRFFPGMGLTAAEKCKVVAWALGRLNAQFDVVGTGEHARQLVAAGVPRTRSASVAGPRR